MKIEEQFYKIKNPPFRYSTEKRFLNSLKNLSVEDHAKMLSELKISDPKKYQGIAENLKILAAGETIEGFDQFFPGWTPDKFERLLELARVDEYALPKILRDDLAWVNQLNNNEKFKNEISSHIDNIIKAYEESKKRETDFNFFKSRIYLLNHNNNFSRDQRNIVDRSWKQDQVDSMLKIFEENSKFIGADQDKDKFYGGGNFFWSNFVTHIKLDQNDNAISTQLAKSLGARIENGGPLPASLCYEISGWAQSIQMVRADARLELLVAALNNPGKLDHLAEHEIQANLALYGSEIIEDLRTRSMADSDNIAKILRAIDVLQFLSNKYDETGFEDSAEIAYHELHIISSETNNYFVKIRINQALYPELYGFGIKDVREILSQEWQMITDTELFRDIFGWEANPDDFISINPLDQNGLSDEMAIYIAHRLNFFMPEIFFIKNNFNLREKYDEADLREKYEIIPLTAEIAHDKEEAINYSVYGRLNDKFGVIYTRDGRPDTFFRLSSRPGRSKEVLNNKIKPEKISIAQMLAEEGYQETDGKQDFKRMASSYRTLISLPYRYNIEQEFGIDIKHFSLREQMQFIDFLSIKSIAEVEKIKKFLDEGGSQFNKNNRIKSFLSLESGKFSGDDIIMIEESFKDDPGLANKLFAVYASLVDRTAITKDELSEIFKNKKKIKDEEISQISRMILQKANDLLSSYTRKITAGQEINEQELLAELAGYEAELVSMGAVLATLKKQFQQDLRPEDIQGVEFKEKVSAAQLTLQGRIWPALEQLVVFRDGRPMIPDTALSGALAAETGLSEEERQASNRVRQMLDIYARNYAHNPALRDELIAGLWEKLKTGQESTRFYLYEKNGQVIAFNRFDDEGAGRKHFGSCNVAAGAKDSTIGDALYRQSIREEGPGFLVEAIVKPFSPAMHLYVDKDQFVAEEIEDDKAISFVIRRYGDQKNAPSFALKGLSPEQIKNIYQQQDNHPDAYLGKDSFVWQGNNEEEAIAWAKKALAAGQEPRYRITRYFLDKDKKLYVGFEKI